MASCVEVAGGACVLNKGGGATQDTWVEGHGYKEVQERMAELKLKKDSLENIRKALLKQKPAASALSKVGYSRARSVFYGYCLPV